jgi:D-beta-D-heptose 7-phosphate kinase / D-beta-D-heptose 1-phosphate adenosyltransferase
MSYILPPDLAKQLEKARSAGQDIVLVTGVFDILHEEHVAFLRAAKNLGGFLLVGLESDLRVGQLKGPDRPINSESQRLANLHTLSIVDAVFILPEQFSKPSDHEALIMAIKPTYLAVSEHTAHLDAKAAILAKVGGQVIVVREHNPLVSTTLLLKNTTK